MRPSRLGAGPKPDGECPRTRRGLGIWTRTHREEPVGGRGGGQCCSRTAPGAGGGCRSRGGASPTGPGEQRPWHTPTSDFWPQSLGLSPHAVDSLLQQPPETHTHALVWSLVLARATGPSPARPARFFLPCPRPQQTRPQQTRPQDRSSSRSAHPRDWAASASLGFLPGHWPLRRKLPTRTDVPGVPSLSRLVATTALGDRCPGEGRFAAVSENSREPIQRSGRPGRRPSAGSKRPPGRKAPSPAGVLPAGPPQQASARTAAPWGAMACSPKPALGVTTVGSSGEQLAPGLSRSHSKGLTCGETRPPPRRLSPPTHRECPEHAGALRPRGRFVTFQSHWRA